MKIEKTLLQNGEKKRLEGHWKIFRRKVRRKVKRGINGIRRIIKN